MLTKDPCAAEIRILHIEDDDDDALLVSRTLDRIRQVVHLRRAVHGAAAVALLTKEDEPPVDLIILDLNMPVMDGYQFLAWLRSKPHFDSVPVVVLTTVTNRARLEDLCRRGANAALSKDMTGKDEEELVQIIVDLWFHGSVDALERELA